jgi:GT2 family glycosyltransferase
MTAVADLSVVIATLDRPDALARCLDALFAGSMLPGEIIVVDQSRDECTRDIFAGRETWPVPMTYVRQARRGLSASRNAGLAHATRACAAVTDDDCIPDCNWVAALAAAFASPECPGAVTGRVLPHGPEQPGLYPVSSRASTRRVDYSGPVGPWWVGTGANLAVRQDWLRRIGEYDERLGAGSPGSAGEDLDMIYRLLRAGARIRYEPDAVIYHERQTRERRIATRSSYGRGIGAFFGAWLRAGDWLALGLLVLWMRQRARILWGALRERNWTRVREQLLVHRGTLQGLRYGATLRGKVHAAPPAPGQTTHRAAGE